MLEEIKACPEMMKFFDRLINLKNLVNLYAETHLDDHFLLSVRDELNSIIKDERK